MFEDQFLNDFIDNAVNRARNNIQQKGKLETDDAIPLMLKSQFNHIAHLEMDMLTKTEFEIRINTLVTKAEIEARLSTLVTKSEFEAKINTLVTKTEIESRFKAVDERFALLQWTVGIGFTFMAFLQTYVSFFK